MRAICRSLSLVFAAGCLGGMANALVVWLFGVWGISSALGVDMAPALTPAMIYPRVVWGGLWGVVFLLPLAKKSWFARGFFWSLAPSVGRLMVVFPYKDGVGFLGLELGWMTPLLVIFSNAVWGWVTALWILAARERR